MVKEAFANRFEVMAAEAVAGTLAFTEVPTYANAFSKEAFILHKVEYLIGDDSLVRLVAAGDYLAAGISTSNRITSAFDLNEPALIDRMLLYFQLRGAAANGFFHEEPLTHDFTSLPGGGIIVPARPIYGFIQGVSLGGTVQCRIKGYFTRVELKGDEFLELVDAYRLVST